MMAIFASLLDRLLSQEVARSNAAHEANRLQHSRRRLDDINAFLAAHHNDSAKQQDAAKGATTAQAYAQRSRPQPP